MTDTAIRVENLSKRYRIGLEEEMHDTLAGAITDTITRPIRNLRRLRRLSTFEDGHQTNQPTNKLVPEPPTNPPSDIIWALRDVSFEVARGEVVGIIGRNGAGKSTLLKILSRITHPTSGRVELNGRVSSLLEVGTGFHPELTGRENIYLNGAILGMTKAEIDRKFDEMVDFSGVEKFIDTPVKRFSSGMKVRLAFSVAAHLDPEVLLIDEVLAVGDVEFQKKCLGKMENIAQYGRTVLFVSHNMAAINNLCEKALLLDSGHIASRGPAGQVVSHYLGSNMDYEGIVRFEENRDAAASIRLVGIMTKDKQYTSTIPVTEVFFIRIGFTVSESIKEAQVGFNLVSSSGLPVFVSTHRDSNHSLYSTFQPGVYEADIPVPAHFLNCGTYSLNVAVLGHTQGHVRQYHSRLFNTITFSVEDTGSISHILGDSRQGVVTPILDWDVNKLTEARS